MYWSAVDGHVIYESAEATSVGTIAHAAPEQLMGENIDGRADRYALAAMTYHLLTGTLLNSSTNPAVVISRRLTEPPPAICAVHPAQNTQKCLGPIWDHTVCALLNDLDVHARSASRD